MALRCIAGSFLRCEVRKQLCFSLQTVNQTVCKPILPQQFRFASNDAKPEVITDCSGTACVTIKRGTYCAPGTEEYCIAGHMPGEEEDVVVGEHSTVTPGQYSVLGKQTPETKDGKTTVKEEATTQGTAST